MRNILFAAALALAASVGCSNSEAQKSDKPAAEPADRPAAEAKLPEMTVDEVDQALASGQAKAVDCNNDHTRKRMGVVPGAILVSDDESFAASELPADKAGKLIFYCANPG
jgi:hypothetical protein